MKNFASRLLVLFLCLLPMAAFGQSTGRVVADCATGVPLAYAIGSTSLMTMLPNGAACANGPNTTTSIPITISTATTTLLVTGVANKSIYVTAVDIIAAGTGNIQFISGTGATCGTGTANVTGNYNLTAQVGFTKGSGSGALWVLPAGTSLCAVTSQAVGMPGSLAYAIY